MSDIKSLEEYKLDEIVSKIDSLSSTLDSYSDKRSEYIQKMQLHLIRLKQLSAKMKG